MSTVKKTYKVGDKIIFDKDKFFIYEGRLSGEYTKIFKTFCNICANSENSILKDAMLGGKFTVSLPQATRSIISGTFPCGCSPRIERISQKLGIDIHRNYTFKTDAGSTITLLDRSSEGFRYFHCSFCSVDKELFPNPLENKTYRLLEHRVNCGCSGGTKWKEAQNKIRVTRKCGELSYTFKGWVEGYKGKATKCKISCPDHGEYHTCSIDNLLRGRTCPRCADIRRGEQTGNQNGYYASRKGEEDTLYLISMEDNLKVGRSFNMYDRSRSIFLESGKGFTILATYTGKHEYVYKVEQSVLKAAKEDRRRLFLGWTWEALTLDSEDFVKGVVAPYLESGELKKYIYRGKLHNSSNKEA